MDDPARDAETSKRHFEQAARNADLLKASNFELI